MSNTAREEAMAKALDSLWSLYREAEGFSGKEAIDQVLYTSKQALRTLEELAPDVLGDGGVHGSPDRAWEVFQDVAISTGDTLTQAIGFGERWSLTGYLKSAGQVLLDTAENIAAGANSMNTTIRIVAIVVGLYFLAKIAGGRGAAA